MTNRRDLLMKPWKKGHLLETGLYFQETTHPNPWLSSEHPGEVMAHAFSCSARQCCCSVSVPHGLTDAELELPSTSGRAALSCGGAGNACSRSHPKPNALPRHSSTAAGELQPWGRRREESGTLRSSESFLFIY